jgi:hypothetical protein
MSKKTQDQWSESDFEPEHELVKPLGRRPVDADERDDLKDWLEERGARGRKRRDKAGGRHERTRQRELDD